ncbi:MAG: hypothetical protein C5B57_07160 [Blastocatellia bacterium]|nr:MAG: hypothetical protein C5B57_07160 [Blastocatellia bacterium]
MKRALVTIVAFTLLTPGAFASNGTWTGTISDSGCGASHAAMKKQHGGKMTNAQCTEACVKGGAKYVFVSGGKAYKIANQDERDLAAHAGKSVRLSGEMQGDTITVSKVAAASKKKASKKKAAA